MDQVYLNQHFRSLVINCIPWMFCAQLKVQPGGSKEPRKIPSTLIASIILTRRTSHSTVTQSALWPKVGKRQLLGSAALAGLMQSSDKGDSGLDATGYRCCAVIGS